MADTTSIGSAVVGIVDVSSRLVNDLIAAQADRTIGDQDINRTIEEIQSLETLCKSIPETVKEEDIFDGARRNAATVELLHYVKSTLDESRDTLQEFERQLKALSGGYSKSKPTFDEIRLFLRNESQHPYIIQFWQDIVRHYQSLDLCLTIAKVTALRHVKTTSSQAWSEVATSLHVLDNKLQEQIQLFEFMINSLWQSASNDQIRILLQQAKDTLSLTSLNEHFMLPRATTSAYAGRADDFTDLQNAYQQVKYARFEKRFVVHGPGGSGKTEFCSRFAIENRHQFWGVFFLDASNVASESASYAEIARIADVEPIPKSVKHWLATQGRPWLLIVDDLDGFLGTGSRDRFFSDCENGLILITTRDSTLRLAGNFGNKALALKGLQQEDSANLLLTLAGFTQPYLPHDLEHAVSFCTRVEHLPLAIVDAGTAILQGHCTLDTCLAYFETCLAHVQNLIKKQDLRNGGSMLYETVFATMEMNLPAISPDALELLKVLCFMHRNNFALEILIQAVMNVRLEAQAEASPGPSPTIKGQTMSATASKYARDAVGRLYNFFVKLGEKHVGTGLLSSLGDASRDSVESELRNILCNLEEVALIQYVKSEESYSIHPLHHWWVRESMTLPERAVWCCVARDVLANVILLPPLGMTEEYAQLRRRMLPHIEHVKEHELIIQAKYQANLLARSKLLPSTEAGVGRNDIRRFAKFAMVYAENGQWKEASELLTTVDQFLTANLGVDNSITIKSRLFLSETYFWQAKETKAIEIQRGLLEACSKARGATDPHTLTVMDKLGFSLWMEGKFIEARTVLDKAVTGLLEIHPRGSVSLYIAMTHLGRVLGKLADFDEAVELNSAAVTGLLATVKPGQSERDVLDAKESAAMARYDRNRYLRPSKEDLRLAFHLERDVYTTREKMFGKQHPLTLYALVNLARINAARGDVIEAERMMREGIPIAERNLGKDNLGTLFGKAYFGHILMVGDKFVEAEDVLKQVVQQHEVTRRHHPDQLVAAAFLLECYSRQAKMEEARTMHAKVMQGIYEIYGPGSWWEGYFMMHYKVLDELQVKPSPQTFFKIDMPVRRSIDTPVSPPR